MKNLVIDSGISVKWFVAETDSPKALEILKAYQSDRVTFLAPNLIYAEFDNIVRKKQIFQGLDPRDAGIAIQKFKK